MTSFPSSAAEIIALGNAELGRASSLYRGGRLLQILTFAASIAAIFASGISTYFLALVALVSQSSSWATRYRARLLQSVGDEARSRGLLLDALDTSTEPVDMAILLNRFSSKARLEAAGSENPDYFASDSQPGLRRLRENLQENAFWAKCQYDSVVTDYYKQFAAFAVVALLAVLVAIPLAPRDQAANLARILVAALTFGAGFTQLNEIQLWKAAARRLEAVDRRLESLVPFSDIALSQSRLESVLAVFADYCVATTAAPPVPTKIYLRDRIRLNAVWDDRRKRYRDAHAEGGPPA